MAKKAYVYEQTVCAVSSNWHNGGGALIVTDGDPDEAWRASSHYASVRIAYKDDDGKLGDPDHVLAVADDSPDMVVVFPDVGCC